MVRLWDKPQCWNITIIRNFNSTMVRLWGHDFVAKWHYNKNFNSTMVRLWVISIQNLLVMLLYFNSTMVRLWVTCGMLFPTGSLISIPLWFDCEENFLKQYNMKLLFQFHYGSIVRMTGLFRLNINDVHFNSTMVRLWVAGVVAQAAPIANFNSTMVRLWVVCLII